MTNKEVLNFAYEKHLFTDSDSYTLKDINIIQDLTRADERATVIKEIEDWVSNDLNTVESLEYTGELIFISTLIDKLNQLNKS